MAFSNDTFAYYKKKRYELEDLVKKSDANNYYVKDYDLVKEHIKNIAQRVQDTSEDNMLSDFRSMFTGYTTYN